MAAGRVDAWQSLLRQALAILDSAFAPHAKVARWSLGGGTVLMLRYRHRLSKDIEIFIPDPQMLGYLKIQALAPNYVEEANFLKLYLPEGEIDFVAAGPITAQAVRKEKILGRDLWVETSAEIVAKKVWHRAAHFTARDVVDLAVVATREPRALLRLKPLLAARRTTLLERLATHEAALREDFAALDLLELQASFEECLEIVREAVGRGDRAEQPRAAYWTVTPDFRKVALTPFF